MKRSILYFVLSAGLGACSPGYYHYVNEGQELAYQESFQEAISAFEKAIEQKPEAVIPYFYRGQLKMAIGDFEGSRHDFGRVLGLENAKEKDVLRAYLSRGRVWENEQNYEMAIREYNRALALDPSFHEARFSRGTAYYFMGNHEEAREDFDEVIRLNKYHTTSYYNRAVLKMHEEDLAGAIDDCNRAIRQDRSFYQAYYLRGQIKLKLNYFRGSYRDFSETIRINPRFGYAWYFRGLSQQHMGRQRRAKKDWQMALVLGVREAAFYLDKYADS